MEWLYGKREDVGKEEEMMSLVGWERERSEKSPGGGRSESNAGTAAAANTNMEEGRGSLVVSIKGMHCSSCSSAVESALNAVPGVFKAQVSLLGETGEVVYDVLRVGEKEILQAIQDAGFECGGVKENKRPGVKEGGRAVLQVSGMHCSSCSSAVEKALKKVPKVLKASVSLSTNQAEVLFEPGTVMVSDLLQAVKNAGFEAQMVKDTSSSKIVLAVEGMTCSSCSSAVENGLNELGGVVSARVNLMSHTAEVLYESSIVGPRNIIEKVESLGFLASLQENDNQSKFYDQNERETARYRRLATWSAVFTIPVFLIAMVFPWLGVFKGLYRWTVFDFPVNEILKFVLVTPVQFVIGWPFHVGSYKALKSGRANMDVLVSLGTNASYIYSVISIVHHHYVKHHESGDYQPTDFFETSAMLISFVLLGKFLESSAKGKTSEAIVKLCAMVPGSAILLETSDSGEPIEKEIPSALIQKYDLLKVMPGARIPADGKVVYGSTFIDESMLTGESKPVGKQAGDHLYGGTMNAGGVIHMEAEKIGSDTALSQIVRLVENAQLSKAPVQAVADQISSVFVPVVVSLSVLTTLFWFTAGLSGFVPEDWIPKGHSLFLFSLLFGIAVMVIACPCALGLATPTAVMVGTGVAATNGVLIKGGDILEKATGVTTVLFDKTGTVTSGKPSVVDLHLIDDTISGSIVTQVAASLERSSEHPLASAILNFEDDYLSGKWTPQPRPSLLQRAKSTTGRLESIKEHQVKTSVPPAQDVEILVGEGLSAIIQAPLELQKALKCSKSCSVLIGSANLLAKNRIEGIGQGTLADQYAREMESRGCTCIYLAVDMQPIAIFSIMDPIKPESRGVVAALHQMKLKCALLTGDNWRTARAVASQLGITLIHAEVLPGGKVDVVTQLQSENEIVAMVGDGINDSPALAKSDVGIAIGSGADVAIEAADIVLVKSDLEDVLMALDLCRATFRRIKWNYIWALGYNLVMVPVAAGCLYPTLRFQLPPWIAGGCMALSSVSVVASSLLLRMYQRPRRVLRD